MKALSDDGDSKCRFLTHEHIYFREVEEDDFVVNYKHWRNDPITTKLLFKGTLPSTKQELKDEYYKLINSPNDVIFAICENKSDIHFGFVGLHNINWISRHAEHISFFDRSFWSKGYAKEMMDLSVGYGFNRLNLNKIYAGVNVENVPSLKMCERNGWKKEGVWRMHQYRNGRWYDAVFMSILRDEFCHRADNELYEVCVSRV